VDPGNVAFPAAWLEPNTPPISNQGMTPQCVAYSAANDQGHMDRPESGAFPAYDRPKIFAEIGGGPNGAYVRSALARRLHVGYPLKATPDQAAAHRISALCPRPGTCAAHQGCNGAPDRIRTCDLRLRRPTLYPLSYRRADRDDTR
jgi:hypothetical protein